MPDGLAALRALGIELPPNLGFLFSGIRFLSGEKAVDACFPRGKGIGVRRTLLHQVLLDEASRLGVDMHWGARVTALGRRMTMDGRPVESKWLIAADGQNSATRKWAGLDRGKIRRRRFGFRRHYRVEPWSEFVEISWSDRAQMYITPVASDRVCVALITGDQHLRFHDGLRLFPAVESHLQNAIPITHEQGALSPSRQLDKVYSGNLALIGEASGSVDAITGDGLSLAFQQAVVLASAMRNENLSAYQSEHRRIAQLPRFMAEVMLAMDGRPRFRNRVFSALTANPVLFERMLAVHTGALAPLSFGARSAASLGWHLITA
ncbi:MAG: monooxygenase, FAD-binding [Acidobacteriaceae bacterium]|nr:monooxygenase, FAD-binding [Acidobacteriaceae bacterium]